jgi:hypothetical protein
MSVRLRSALAVGAVAVAVLAVAAPAGAEPLPIDRVLPGDWEVADCIEGPSRVRCFLVEFGGLVPGLGDVTFHERVLQSGDLDDALCEPQVRYGTIVAPRGTVDYVAHGIDCPGTRELLGGYRGVVVTWDVVGGTGAYVGATGSGTGTVRPDEEEVFVHMLGTVDVPGVEFDTAPPVLSGIPRAMRVRGAGRTTVRFAKPVARDAVDGDVAVSCTPASGSRFARGPTTVACSAADSSGNVAEARFRVLVRKP